MSQDQMQTLVNRMSLVMTIPEDIVKMCKRNDLSPDHTEVLLRLHNQQFELEKAINELRTIMTQMAQVVEVQANMQVNFVENIDKMAKSIGYSPDEVASE